MSLAQVCYLLAWEIDQLCLVQSLHLFYVSKTQE